MPLVNQKSDKALSGLHEMPDAKLGQKKIHVETPAKGEEIAVTLRVTGTALSPLVDLVIQESFAAAQIVRLAEALPSFMKAIKEGKDVAGLLESNPPTIRPNEAIAPSPENSVALPEVAPKLYADRPKGQGIIDFLRDPDGWGPYVAARLLTRPDLRKLDRAAYDALTSWLQHHDLPSDIKLPKKSDVIDMAVARISADTALSEQAVRRLGRTLVQRQRKYSHK